MCDQVIKRITLGNFPAVGESDDKNFFVGKTSIQYVNPFPYRFTPSTTKMSKNASVLAVGAWQQAENDFGIIGDFTNRRGLHIYVRRACGPSSGKGYEEWSHIQSIIRDAEDEYLQVNEAAVSFDGSSIITLSRGQFNSFGPPSSGPQIYVFERESTCQKPDAKWSIQQTLTQANFSGNPNWNLISSNDDQTVLVIQFDTDNHYAIYTRERAQKHTAKVATESEDGYVFKLLQTILPSDLPVVSLGPISALSHDGKTLMITATFADAPTLRVIQMEYDCEENEYVPVSTFPVDASEPTVVLLDMKFGGACSERLFFLVQGGKVLVHSRKKKNGASNCLLKTSLRPNCCATASLVNFSTETLVGTVLNVLPTTLQPNTTYIHSLLTEAINGDLFIVYSTIDGPQTGFPNIVSVPVPLGVGARVFRQKPCVSLTADEWCNCELDEAIDFPELVFYRANAYDMLSFDSSCQRFTYPVRQQILPIAFPPATEAHTDSSHLYVADPDGCFYLMRFDQAFIDPENPPYYWYYFRVTDSGEPFAFGNIDAQFGEIFNGLAYSGSKISINAKTCKSKYLDIKVVDARANPVAPSPMQLLVTPSLVYYSLTIPMRLCFGVLAFNKSAV